MKNIILYMDSFKYYKFKLYWLWYHCIALLFVVKYLTIVLSDSRAVASLNTPLFPVDPNKNPMQTLKSIPVFEYQIYFQEPVSDMFSLAKLFRVCFNQIVLYCILLKTTTNPPKHLKYAIHLCKHWWAEVKQQQAYFLLVRYLLVNIYHEIDQ